MDEAYNRIAEELAACTDNPELGIEIVKAAQLKRIADSLECIESHLESVDESLDGIAGNIDGCMSRGRLGDAFCITGNITAY